MGDIPQANGTITTLYGCMFSGKTTELLRRLDEYPPGEAAAFKHAVDTRYSASRIVSHRGKGRPAIVVRSAEEIAGRIDSRTRIAAIDEAHFFDDGLVEVVGRLARRGVDVVLTSLHPDSWGRPFSVTSGLLGIAAEAELCLASCARCAAPADRTQRLTPILNGRMVVEPSNYESRCQRCWVPPIMGSSDTSQSSME